QWRGNEEIARVTSANVATAKAFDVDGVGRGFATLSERHAQLATQLMALDASNVDPTAIDYRERLVAAHQALSEAYAANASATESRGAEELSQGQSRMKPSLTEYAQLCNEKDSIMAVLKERYRRDFDV